MIKGVYVLLLSFLVVGCAKNAQRLGNGLTKPASEVKEYVINLDSTFSNIDTLRTILKTYNSDNLITKRIENTYFDSGNMELDFIYNANNDLVKEVLTMSENMTIEVNYIYKDSLVYQTVARFANDRELFEGIETYFYDHNGNKEKTVSSQLFIDVVTNDTITNSTQIGYYNADGFVERSESTYHNNPKRNRTWKYEYNDHGQSKQYIYNDKDSLLSTMVFEYKTDQFDNWIEKKEIKDGKVTSKRVRTISYR